MEHQCNHNNDIIEMKEDIKSLLRLMNGNGELGICAKVQIMWKVALFIVTAVSIQLFVLLRMVFS